MRSRKALAFILVIACAISLAIPEPAAAMPRPAGVPAEGHYRMAPNWNAAGAARQVAALAAPSAGAGVLKGVRPLVFGPDDDIPGVVLPASPVSGSLAYDDEWFDTNVYRVNLSYGDTIDVSITGSGGSSVQALFYPPGTSSIFEDDPTMGTFMDTYPNEATFFAEESGTHYIALFDAELGAASYTMSYSITTSGGNGAVVRRVWGNDRYATSLAISQDAFESDSTSVAVVASGASFPDALSASGLAGMYGAPLLLTPKAGLPAGLVVELDRVGADYVFLIGSEAAVSANVEQQLIAAGREVYRVEGPDRYATSKEIVATMHSIIATSFPGFEGFQNVFVARGDNFADALAASPMSYVDWTPIVLTPPTSLSPYASNAIQSYGLPSGEGGVDAWILGSEAAVSPGVESAIDGLSNVAMVDRIAGDTRYDTAVMIADFAIYNTILDPAYTGIASGVNFPDALSGGAAAGLNGGILLMTAPQKLSLEPAYYLGAYIRFNVMEAVVYGGTPAVSDTAKNNVNAILN